MNKKRKQQTNDLKEQLCSIKIELERIAKEEENAFSNLPESLQESERGEEMEENVDCLNDAVCNLEEVIDCLTNIN